ncbi:MAG: PatB family C-S lyase [Chitinophagales bacterium]|nr:PatB family C-S lyase [Chitinophagales bacterium]
MNPFNIINEDYQHQFARQDPKMLKNMFGSEDLTPFWIADMDFRVAQPITDELKRLVERGIYAYEFATQDVYNAIVDWNNKRHQLSLDTKSFLQISGVLTGISLLIRELTEPNDGILIQTPVYHQFAQIIKKSDRRIVRNPLQIIDGKYEMDFKDLEKKLQTENVKIILLCNPHNPVGRVWKKEELEKLTALANKHGVTIVSDEIHSDIIYSGHRFNSILSLGQKNHIAMLGSPAKTFGMQSISNGYIYIPNETIRKQIKNTIGAMYLNHGNALTTFATIAAFKEGGIWLDDLLHYLERNISWIQDFVQKELPFVKMYPIEGTYQAWLDFREMNLNKEELDQLITEKAKLALTPGNWFDRDSALFMRMNIASPLTKIQTAFKQLQTALSESI